MPRDDRGVPAEKPICTVRVSFSDTVNVVCEVFDASVADLSCTYAPEAIGDIFMHLAEASHFQEVFPLFCIARKLPGKTFSESNSNACAVEQISASATMGRQERSEWANGMIGRDF